MSVDYGHCNYFFENIINVRSVDQMRKRYDFKIKGVFATCNESQGCQNPYNPDFDAYIYRHISNSNFYKYQSKYVKMFEGEQTQKNLSINAEIQT